MYICKRQNEISKHTGIIGTCENFSIKFKQNLPGIHNSTYKIDQTVLFQLMQSYGHTSRYWFRTYIHYTVRNNLCLLKSQIYNRCQCLFMFIIIYSREINTPDLFSATVDLQHGNAVAYNFVFNTLMYNTSINDVISKSVHNPETSQKLDLEVYNNIYIIARCWFTGTAVILSSNTCL